LEDFAIASTLLKAPPVESIKSQEATEQRSSHCASDLGVKGNPWREGGIVNGRRGIQTGDRIVRVTEFSLSGRDGGATGETDGVDRGKRLIWRSRKWNISDKTADQGTLVEKKHLRVWREGFRSLGGGVKSQNKTAIILELGKSSSSGLTRVKTVVRGGVDGIGDRMVEFHCIGVHGTTNGNAGKGLGLKLSTGPSRVQTMAEETNGEEAK
jgi:hypothetical protein